MHDPDPHKEPQQPPSAQSGGLVAEVGASKHDSPAIPSNLRTHDEVAFELELEGLRVKREERKALAWNRRAFIVLLALLTSVGFAAVAVAAVALTAGELRVALPALACGSGSGATATLLWRAYASRFTHQSRDQQ